MEGTGVVPDTKTIEYMPEYLEFAKVQKNQIAVLANLVTQSRIA